MSNKNDKDAEAKAKADAEAKAKAEAEAEQAKKDQDEGEDENADEEGEDGSSSKTIDYKAELEKERKAREEAERLIAESKFKSKHKKHEIDEDEDEGDDDEDKPLTRKELNRLLEQTQAKSIKLANAGRIEEIANELADSQEEAELIVEIHKNRQFPSYLSIKEQVEEAQAIANRKKMISQKSELARALRAKDNASKDGSSAHRDGQAGTAPKMSAQDESAYKRAGFAYDTKDKLWKKKLPSGKFLCKDPKTKASWVK